MDKTPGAELYQPPDHHSISSLVTASKCPRLAFYGNVLDTETSLPARYGTAIHAALPSALNDGIDAAMEEFDKAWSDPEDPEEFDEVRNRTRAEALLADFIKSHEIPRYTLIEPPDSARSTKDDVSGYEIEFTQDIGVGWPLVGRIDGLVRTTDTDELFALEFKTSYEVSDRFHAGFTFNPQAVGYAAVLRASGVQVKGTIVETLRTSKTREETAATVIYVSKANEQAFFRWAYWQARLVELYAETGVWPQQMAACTSYPYHYFPSRKCYFAPLCEETADWRNLASLYKDPTTNAQSN